MTTVKQLLDQVKWVGKVVSHNPVAPILENLYFHSGTLWGSDLQLTRSTPTEIKGEFLIQRRLLQRILEELPGKEEVRIKFDKESLKGTIECENVRLKYTLTLDDAPKDWPKQVEVFEPKSGLLLAEDVTQLKLCSRYISRDELRPALTGIYCHSYKSKSTMVATDGHTLIWLDFKSVKLPVKGILPGKLIKILDPCDHQVTYNVSLACFSSYHGETYTRLLDERYPDYMNVIPSKEVTKHNFTMDRAQFVKACKRALITANVTTHQARFSFQPPLLKISSQDLDYSNEMETEIPCSGVNDLLVGYNVQFLIECLEQDDKTELTMRTEKENRAGIFSERILIMPVMLSDNL